MVFAPTWDLPANLRFTASADYYNIDIKGAIGYINANLTYQLCFKRRRQEQSDLRRQQHLL